MKLKDILVINNAIRVLMDSNDIQLDASIKFKMLTILKQCSSHVENFESLRNEKIQEYGSKDDDGNYTIAKDDVVALRRFSSDINELAQTDVDINLQKIKANEIMKYSIPSAILVDLYDVIEED